MIAYVEVTKKGHITERYNLDSTDYEEARREAKRIWHRLASTQDMTLIFNETPNLINDQNIEK